MESQRLIYVAPFETELSQPAGEVSLHRTEPRTCPTGSTENSEVRLRQFILGEASGPEGRRERGGTWAKRVFGYQKKPARQWPLQPNVSLLLLSGQALLSHDCPRAFS